MARKEEAERAARSLEEKAAEERTLESQAEAADALKMKEDLAAGGTEAGTTPLVLSNKKAEPAAVPVDEKQVQFADAEAAADMARPREQVKEVSDGIVDGVEAPLQKDKANEMHPAVPAVSTSMSAPAAVRAEERQKSAAGIPPKAAAPGQAKGAVSRDEGLRRTRLSRTSATTGAVQLLLAVTGRAAAPLAIEAPRWHVLVEGDVTVADLLDPGQLDEWEWLPEGLALELEIAANGTVAGVTPLGGWAPDAAAKAKAAGRKLAFSPAARKTRRCVLRARSDPN